MMNVLTALLFSFFTAGAVSYDQHDALTSLGDGLWRTFAHQTALPLSVKDAESAGWTASKTAYGGITNSTSLIGTKFGDCNPDLGILYTLEATQPTEKHPLGLYFNSAGQVSGVQVTIFGSGGKIGNAAPDNLVEKGYWKVTPGAEKTWTMDVSFRASEEMCGAEDGVPARIASSEILGDRVVINQDTIKHSIPLTAKEAQEQLWSPGSCMESMGWHHFYDLKSAPEQSYEEDQLLPLVAMYHPPDSTGKLNAFFFTSPVSQPGSSLKYLLSGAADWESPALTQPLMCQNWCDDDRCAFDTFSWATMHIYVSSAWETLTCPGGSGPVGRSCEF